MNTDDILLGLDPQQRQAVTATSGIVIVRAGAGSGKTTVLTRRVAWRAANSTADLEHVLAITFTRQAASELSRRIRTLRFIDDEDAPRQNDFTAGTFHAIALRLLKQRFADTNRAAPLVITNRMALLSTTAGADSRGGGAIDLMNLIDWAHARHLAPTDIGNTIQKFGRQMPVSIDRFIEIFTNYEKAKRKRGVVDLNDLISLVVHEARYDAAFAASIRWQYRHIHVDEAQDMNPLQYSFLRVLVGATPDLFIVGDPHQAIYGWNGADHTLFDELPDLSEGSQVIDLPSNYRCSPQIVAAAVHILKNAGHVANEKSLRLDGAAITTVRCATEQEELTSICQQVIRLHSVAGSWNSIAVLARTNKLASEIASALLDARVPVQDTRPGRGYVAALAEASSLGSRHALAVWAADVIDTPDNNSSDDSKEIATLIRSYLSEHPSGPVDGRSFQSWATTTAQTSPQQGVEVLTFHAAKGREWNAVIVSGAETGLLPHSSATSPEAQKEEGRLAYVACTRAAQHLVITWTDRRGGKRTGPSELLRKLPLGEMIVSAPTPEIQARRKAAPVIDPLAVALNQWRQTAARASNCAPEAVLTDSEMQRLVLANPQSDSDIVAVLGPIIGTRYSARILAAIADR